METTFNGDYGPQRLSVELAKHLQSSLQAACRDDYEYRLSRAAGVTPNLYKGSPYLFCLQSFDKIPWR